MPGMGEARYEISTAALMRLLRGISGAESDDVLLEIITLHHWMRDLPNDAHLMEVKCLSEGKSGFEIVVSSVDLPQAYQLPKSLYDPESVNDGNSETR